MNSIKAAIIGEALYTKGASKFFATKERIESIPGFMDYITDNQVYRDYLITLASAEATENTMESLMNLTEMYLATNDPCGRAFGDSAVTKAFLIDILAPISPFVDALLILDWHSEDNKMREHLLNAMFTKEELEVGAKDYLESIKIPKQLANFIYQATITVKGSAALSNKAQADSSVKDQDLLSMSELEGMLGGGVVDGIKKMLEEQGIPLEAFGGAKIVTSDDIPSEVREKLISGAIKSMMKSAGHECTKCGKCGKNTDQAKN